MATIALHTTLLGLINSVAPIAPCQQFGLVQSPQYEMTQAATVEVPVARGGFAGWTARCVVPFDLPTTPAPVSGCLNFTPPPTRVNGVEMSPAEITAYEIDLANYRMRVFIGDLPSEWSSVAEIKGCKQP